MNARGRCVRCGDGMDDGNDGLCTPCASDAKDDIVGDCYFCGEPVYGHEDHHAPPHHKHIHWLKEHDYAHADCYDTACKEADEIYRSDVLDYHRARGDA